MQLLVLVQCLIPVWWVWIICLCRLILKQRMMRGSSFQLFEFRMSWSRTHNRASPLRSFPFIQQAATTPSLLWTRHRSVILLQPCVHKTSHLVQSLTADPFFQLNRCASELMNAHLAVVRLLSLYLTVWVCLGLSQQGVVKSLWPAGKQRENWTTKRTLGIM